MELITYSKITNEGYTLEYKLDNKNDIYSLSNASTHIGEEIYKSSKTNFANNKFKIEFSGNKSLIIDNIEHKIAHYVILQEKENFRYLVSVKDFKLLFTQIILK
ncbi:hypothetical protein [Flavobacterium anhuiense]|uniref:hypothetical protein n=1 Tax=Flavobacterium anhuiense TaxID=459526 RepID=UPI003D98BAC3